MRIYVKAATLTIGLALLLAVGVNQPAFAPPPSCAIESASIEAPAEASVGDEVELRAEVKSYPSGCWYGRSTYNWVLISAPAGTDPWTVASLVVTYIPEIAGQYVFKLRVTGKATMGAEGQATAVHTLSAKAEGSQSGEIQEFALIFGLGSELQAFPETLRVSAGSLRLFLTSLDRAVTVVIRREGAQAGVATVLVESGKLAIVEVELVQGVYGLFDQATGSQLGQIEVR